MNNYTQKTKMWLDSRYRICDDLGIYFAHQPIYGFRKGHSEEGLIERYVRTFHIMRSLAHLKFESLLDVGGAEGYKSYIIKRLFGVTATNSDISEEACRRAYEIFDVESVAGDVHSLPFNDSEFDVVLCSETLEHVVDHHKALTELLRVAKKAVIITVPVESQKTIDKNVEEEIPHGHIHSFTLNSFDYLKSERYAIFGRKIINPLLIIPAVLIEATSREYRKGSRYPKIFFRIYNLSLPLLKKLCGEKTAAFLVHLDDFISRFTLSGKAGLYVIVKDKRFYTKKEHLKISAYNIIRIAVPFHYIQSRRAN